MPAGAFHSQCDMKHGHLSRKSVKTERNDSVKPKHKVAKYCTLSTKKGKGINISNYCQSTSKKSDNDPENCFRNPKTKRCNVIKDDDAPQKKTKKQQLQTQQEQILQLQRQMKSLMSQITNDPRESTGSDIEPDNEQ